jgi:hypothetical protein
MCTPEEFAAALREANPNFSQRMINHLWRQAGGNRGAINADALYHGLVSPKTRAKQLDTASRPRLTRAEAEAVFARIGETLPGNPNAAVGNLPHLVPNHGHAFPDSVASVRGVARHGNKTTHVAGAEAEAHLAWRVHNMPDEVVVRWGAPVTSNGADVISVNLRTGTASLWDAKHSIHPGRLQASYTFTDAGRLSYAVRQARAAIAADTTLPPQVRQQALQNLTNNQFGTNTVGFGRLAGQQI